MREYSTAEKTEFEAKVVIWADESYDSTIHVFFREKLNLEERAIRAVQATLWNRCIERDKDPIRDALNDLSARD